jgi:hypothetical protein
MEIMKDLPGDLRELALFAIEDIRKRMDNLQDLLAEPEPETEEGEGEEDGNIS